MLVHYAHLDTSLSNVHNARNTPSLAILDSASVTRTTPATLAKYTSENVIHAVQAAVAQETISVMLASAMPKDPHVYARKTSLALIASYIKERVTTNALDASTLLTQTLQVALIMIVLNVCQTPTELTAPVRLDSMEDVHVMIVGMDHIAPLTTHTVTPSVPLTSQQLAVTTYVTVQLLVTVLFVSPMPSEIPLELAFANQAGKVITVASTSETATHAATAAMDHPTPTAQA